MFQPYTTVTALYKIYCALNRRRVMDEYNFLCRLNLFIAQFINEHVVFMILIAEWHMILASCVTYHFREMRKEKENFSKCCT